MDCDFIYFRRYSFEQYAYRSECFRHYYFAWYGIKRGKCRKYYDTYSACFSIGVFTFWGSGPATAAYSYITRCFTRGEHTWVLSDGADKFKENFKQSMVVVLIDAVLLVFGINAILFIRFTFQRAVCFG